MQFQATFVAYASLMLVPTALAAQTGTAWTMRSWAGACDGSAVVSVDGGYFLNATDEGNVIALYSVDSTKAHRQWDLNDFLLTDVNKRGIRKESDIEAAAAVRRRVFWIGSHGNDKDGNHENSRYRLFATDLTGSAGGTDLKTAGQPVSNLLDDLLKGSSEIAKALKTASALPHQQGGLDIESMAATESGTLLIGFRSPLVQQKAIIIELLNPDASIVNREAPRLSEAKLVDFGGLGVVDMLPSSVANEFFVLAGAVGTTAKPVLYRWKRGDESGRAANTTLPDANLEALARGVNAGQLLVAADDGESGTPTCKDRARGQQSFRVWVQGGR